MFEEIPEAFREGVVAREVETGAPEHPGLPGIWTMGECLTEEWPDGTGGLADTQSRIVLYHGSFRNIARDDPAFDTLPEFYQWLAVQPDAIALIEILHPDTLLA